MGFSHDIWHTNELTRIDTLSVHNADDKGRLSVLRYNWKFKHGDDSTWADPEFDDSQWDLESSTLDKKQLDSLHWAGIGWFRKEFYIRGDMVGNTVDIAIYQTCASEIYINGVKVLSSGVIAEEMSWESCKVTWNASDIVQYTFDRPGKYQIAIRYSSHGIDAPCLGPFPLGFLAGVYKQGMGHKWRTENVNTQIGLRMLFTGFPLAFAILHFFLFLFNPKAIANLYYSLFTLSAAALTFSVLGIDIQQDIGLFFGYMTMFKISIVGVFVFITLFLYKIMEREICWYTYLFFVLSFLAIVFNQYIQVEHLYWMGIIGLFDNIGMLYWGIKKKMQNFYILGLGYLLFVIFCSVQMLMGVGVIPFATGVFKNPYLYGFVVMMITMSIYLAKSFSENIKMLKKEMEERQKMEKIAKEQEEKLIQADKMATLGILVSGVAHEINNPNNYMLLNSNNLQDIWKDLKVVLDKYRDENGAFQVAGMDYLDLREEVSPLITGISEGSERIRKIVESLKDFSRKEPANMSAEININSVVEASLTILSNLIKKSSYNFTVHYGASLPQIKGSFQQIEQVLINLISNSCHALESPEKALKVSTSFDRENNVVLIKVQDEGRGISEENLKHIFDPFFTTKRDSGGTGLGLSISYTIIKDHGGDLTMSSREGKGTIAVISLPIVRADD